MRKMRQWYRVKDAENVQVSVRNDSTHIIFHYSILEFSDVVCDEFGWIGNEAINLHFLRSDFFRSVNSSTVSNLSSKPKLG